jgi:AraC-like DNA-binding protein
MKAAVRLKTMRVVPDAFRPDIDGSGRSGCGSPLQIVSRCLQYFSQHFQDPCVTADMLQELEISEDCVTFSFDQVRGMTPAQALQEHRLNQLFAALTEQPRQGLAQAIKACGLGQTSGVVPLFEQTFGIDMPLFLLTCRRASDDRLFRRLHPDPEALVLAP